MSGKSITPKQVAEAVAMREGGYTTTAISELLAVSVRTLNRVFERHSARKGAVKADLVAAAKRTLLEGVTSNQRVKEAAARIVADDLAHAWALRSRLADASQYLIATNLEESCLVMRAGAAYSTALKNSSDTLRHSLRTDRALDAVEVADLPELTVRVLTEEEIQKMRESQTAERREADPTDELQELDDRVAEDA